MGEPTGRAQNDKPVCRADGGGRQRGIWRHVHGSERRQRGVPGRRRERPARHRQLLEPGRPGAPSERKTKQNQRKTKRCPAPPPSPQRCKRCSTPPRLPGILLFCSPPPHSPPAPLLLFSLHIWIATMILSSFFCIPVDTSSVCDTFRHIQMRKCVRAFSHSQASELGSGLLTMNLGGAHSPIPFLYVFVNEQRNVCAAGCSIQKDTLLFNLPFPSSTETAALFPIFYRTAALFHDFAYICLISHDSKIHPRI